VKLGGLNAGRHQERDEALGTAPAAPARILELAACPRALSPRR